MRPPGHPKLCLDLLCPTSPRFSGNSGSLGRARGKSSYMESTGAAVIYKAKFAALWFGSEPNAWLAVQTLLVLYVSTRLLTDLFRCLAVITVLFTSSPAGKISKKDCGVQTENLDVLPALQLPHEVLLTAHGNCYHTFACGAVKRSNGHSTKQLCSFCRMANRF